MTARLRLAQHFPCDVDMMAKTLADRSFQEAKADALRRARTTVTHFESDDDNCDLTVSLKHRIRGRDLPPVLSRFAANGVSISRTENWTLTPHLCLADLSLELPPGTPAWVEGNAMVVENELLGCTVRFRLTVKVSVPLFGRRIERGVVEAVEDLLDEEAQFISDWLGPA